MTRLAGLLFLGSCGHLSMIAPNGADQNTGRISEPCLRDDFRQPFVPSELDRLCGLLPRVFVSLSFWDSNTQWVCQNRNKK